MKILLNVAYGGFRLSNEFLKAYPEFKDYKYGGDDYYDRVNDSLIKAVEDFGLDTMPDLAIENIPDSCTDWELNEYDGLESVICVVDGKLYHIY